MKLHFVSLGCPKNSVDLETILGGLTGGIELVDDPEAADVALVNTCAFITSAKQEAVETILQLAALKEERPGLVLLVSGCLPQRYRSELEELLPEVDHFFFDLDAGVTAAGIADFLGLPAHPCVQRYRLTPRHYAYLRIAEGCDNRCTYCAIPLIKGPGRSRPLAEIRAEAEMLAADGMREVMIVAQDSTRYGHDLDQSVRLHTVLAALQKVPQLRWIRLLYTHPAHWYPELIEAMTVLDKVVPYIDLPIQHIADPLLRAMGRKSSRSQIEALIETLRRRIPGLALRTSLIVGFPGEGEREFLELCEFVRQTRFERLGVFAYSQEEGTPAEAWPQSLSEEEKEARLQEIMTIQAELSLERNRTLLGRRLQVLVDQAGEEPGTSLARTAWDAPEIDNSVIIGQALAPGSFATVVVTGAGPYDLYAEPAGDD